MPAIRSVEYVQAVETPRLVQLGRCWVGDRWQSTQMTTHTVRSEPAPITA